MKIVQALKPGFCEAMRCENKATDILPLAPFLVGMTPGAAEKAQRVRSENIVSLCAKCAARAFIDHGDAVGRMPEVVHTPRDIRPAVIPTASVEAEIAANAAYAVETAELAVSMSIETNEDFVLFSELLAEIKGKLKGIVSRKEAITKPMNDALKSARDLFRPAEKALAEAEALIKEMIGKYTLREAEAKRAALEAAARAHEAGDVAATESALARVVTSKNVDGLSVRKVWRYEVMDASAVPREFLVVNDAAIGAYAKSTPIDAAPEIAGVRFFVDTIVSSRSA